MAGNDKGTKFTLQRRTPSARSRDDFATVFADDFADRPAMPQDIPIDQIEPSPLQARQGFNNLEELAQSMREHGFTSRIRVRPHPTTPERYQLVYGERRLRAARMAGITIIPCDVAPHSEAELREIGLTENIVREDLNPVDEAQAFEQALAARDDNGQPVYTVRRLAERIGKSAGYVDRRLALLRTPDDVQQLVRERPDTVQIARELAKLDQPEERAPLIEGLLNRTLSSRDVESVVDEARRPHAHRLPQAAQKDEEGTPAAARSTLPARSPVQTHGAAPVKTTSAERMSVRARLQIEQRVNGIIPAVREALPSLQRSDRDALIELIVAQVIPALGELVNELQQDNAISENAER